MKQSKTLIFWLMLCLTLSACGGSESNPATSEASRFTKDMAKGCDLLTTELVASTFNVSAESLEQTKMLGCIYTWRNDTEELSAYIKMPRAHKTTAAAVAWFANTTKSRSADEVQAEMDKVGKQLEETVALDTAAKKSVVKMVLSSADSNAVVYEDVPNVGDEARSSKDGSISVRVDNLTFELSAYQGSRQPETDIAGLQIKQMIEVSKIADQEWAAKSAPQRIQDTAKLAKAIIATL